MRSRCTLTALAFVAAVLSANASARAAGVEPAAATAAQKKDAQAHFSRAHAMFVRGAFGPALNEATASWDLVASPNSRIMIARCLRETGKIARAYAEYSGTIDDANVLAGKEARYAETAKAATSERQALEPQLGWLTVRVDHATASTTVTISGQVLVEAGAWSRPIPEEPGRVEVVVQDGGKEVGRQALTFAAGERKSAEFDVAPSPAVAVAPAPVVAPVEADRASPAASRKRGLRTAALVAGGVGVAGLAVFGISGAIDDTTFSGLQSSCLNNVCPPGKASQISTGRSEQLVANVGLGVGIAGVAAGVTLFALSLGGGGSSAPEADRGTSLVVTPGFVGVRGSL